MCCLICAKSTDDVLCNKCNKIYLYDRKYDIIRKKKRLNKNDFIVRKDNMNELRLYNLLCKIYDKKETFRQAHPKWALSNKNVLLEYDVAIPSKRLLIEYDGKQHYIYPNYFHKTKKEFLKQKSRDRLKTRLAKKNGFKLIRFTYKDNIDLINIKKKLRRL